MNSSSVSDALHRQEQIAKVAHLLQAGQLVGSFLFLANGSSDEGKILAYDCSSKTTYWSLSLAMRHRRTLITLKFGWQVPGYFD